MQLTLREIWVSDSTREVASLTAERAELGSETRRVLTAWQSSLWHAIIQPPRNLMDRGAAWLWSKLPIPVWVVAASKIYANCRTLPGIREAGRGGWDGMERECRVRRVPGGWRSPALLNSTIITCIVFIFSVAKWSVELIILIPFGPYHDVRWRGNWNHLFGNFQLEVLVMGGGMLEPLWDEGALERAGWSFSRPSAKSIVIDHTVPIFRVK